jgi:predicted transcriptional regulator
MLASQIIHTSYPTVNLTDKIAFALQLMEDYDVLHLPVASDGKFAGLVSKDDLLDNDENEPVLALQEQLVKVAVHGNEHILTALKHFAEHQLSLIAVINTQQEPEGVITREQLVQSLSRFMGVEEPGGMIVLEVEKRNYSFGEISRLVETNDAYITQLNTYYEPETGMVQLTLKINRPELSDIIATFQRYEYTVRYCFGEEQYANELKENFNHLIAYLNM